MKLTKQCIEYTLLGENIFLQIAHTLYSNATTPYIIFDPAQRLQVTFVTIYNKWRLNYFFLFTYRVAGANGRIHTAFIKGAITHLSTKMESRTGKCII